MEENLINVSGEEMSETETDYVAAINELKANSVSKEEYAKVRSENKKLLDALVSGKEIDLPKEKPADINELRKKLFNESSDLSNLDYVDTALKLRTALIEKGERDPFLPIGTHVSETAEMYDKAQAVADLLQECVDFADGDSGVFTARYQSVVSDTILPGRGRKR